MTRTFIDSGLLIAAARGTDEVAAKAMEILDDPHRVFMTSDFVRLEVLPKATYHKNNDEVAFYEAFFDAARRTIRTSGRLVFEALQERSRVTTTVTETEDIAKDEVWAGPEVWNRLGNKLLPKLRAGAELQLGLNFSIALDPREATRLKAEIDQVLSDLGLSETVRVELKP